MGSVRAGLLDVHDVARADTAREVSGIHSLGQHMHELSRAEERSSNLVFPSGQTREIILHELSQAHTTDQAIKHLKT